MYRIKEGKLKEYCNFVVFNQGMDCYKGGYILDAKVEEVKEEIGTYNISSMVASENYGEYAVKMRMAKEQLISHSCTCQNYEDKKNKGRPCKHIAASYLKFINEFEVKESEIEDLIKIYSLEEKSLENKIQSLRMQIKLFNSLQSKVQNSIELKVGDSNSNKLYGVKDIKDFILSAFEEKNFILSKTNTINFQHCFINSEDWNLLRILHELIQLEEEISNLTLKEKIISEGKKISIPNAYLNRFFYALGEKSLDISFPFGEYENIHYKKEEPFIDFQLKKNENTIQLIHRDNNIPYALAYGSNLFFYENSIYEFSERRLSYYRPLINYMTLKNKREIVINMEDRESFVSNILPKLKSIGEVHIDEELKEEFLEEPLMIEFYIDKQGQSLTIELKFIYGDNIINPFKENKEIHREGILIRDLVRENQCFDFLGVNGFIAKESKFNLTGEKETIEFIIRGIDELKEMGMVYYSESFKKIKVYSSKDLTAKISLNKEDMLEFSMDIAGLDKEELLSIYEAYKDEKKYYLLKDSGIFLLEEEGIKNLFPIIEHLNIDKEDLLKDKIILNKYMAPYLEDTINKTLPNTRKNKEYMDLVKAINSVEDLDYTLPEKIDKILRNYQRIGFKWLKTLSHYGFGGILADEMGLGKTLQTIALLNSEKCVKPSIIICPTSLVYNWKSEFDKFAPEKNIKVIVGTMEERQDLLKDLEGVEVLITSYPLIKKDIEYYEKIDFKHCILDEAQYIKNPSSQNALEVKKVKSEARFALTGTPIENSLRELWSIFDFIMPGYLFDYNNFYNKFEVPIVKLNDKDTLKELHRKISPFLLRRKKQEVLKDLPEKIEQHIIVDMVEEQKKVYASYAAIAKETILEGLNKKEINQVKIKILGLITRLRQICCDPGAFMEEYKGGSGKLEALHEILDSCLEEGHKVLVFSQFTTLLKIIGDELKGRNINFMYLDGKVNSKERLKRVEEFNKGQHQVFLISLKAGGTGLNLTSADVVIHLDPWWNPAVEDQATDRAHRIGQKNRVEVIKLITKGTIEEKILNLKSIKRHISENVLSEEVLENNILNSMSLEEIKELFQ